MIINIKFTDSYSGNLSTEERSRMKKIIICILLIVSSLYSDSNITQAEEAAPAAFNERIEIIGNIEKNYDKDTGVLLREYTFNEKGELDGLYTIYYPTGGIEKQYLYKNNKPVRFLKSYYENGKLKSEPSFYGYINYYENGKLKSEGINKSHNIVEEKNYNENGGLESIIMYKDGRENGLKKEFNESGKLTSESIYKNGLRDGITKFFYDSGNLEIESNYNNGIPEGSKVFYESGALKQEYNLKHLKYEGISKVFYESGALQVQVNFKDGKKEGIGKSYYESGALETKIVFKNDKALSGILYKENGKIKRKMTSADFHNLGLSY